MAKIQKRPRRDGGTSYRLTWRLGGNRSGEWQSATFADEVSARKAEALVEAHANALTRAQLEALIKPSETVLGETVADAVARYIAPLHIAGSTRREYERDFKLHIRDTPLGLLDLAAVRREHVRLWVRAQVDSGAAPKSVRNRHGLLFAAMKDAVAEGKIARNPCEGVRLPKPSERVDADDAMCFLTPYEVKLIADALPQKYRSIPWLLALTGLRWGELTALRVGDVDLMSRPPRVRVSNAWKRQLDGSMKLGAPKSEKSRRKVTIDSATFDMLLPLVSGKGKAEFVITTIGGGPLPHSTFQKAWNRALYGPKSEKFPGGVVTQGLMQKRPTIHSLRHSQASWLLADAGVTPLEASRRLGHESLAITEQVYAHVGHSDDAAIVAALDRLTAAVGLIPEQSGSGVDAVADLKTGV
jgi:integrase